MCIARFDKRLLDIDLLKLNAFQARALFVLFSQLYDKGTEKTSVSYSVISKHAEGPGTAGTTRLRLEPLVGLKDEIGIDGKPILNILDLNQKRVSFSVNKDCAFLFNGLTDPISVSTDVLDKMPVTTIMLFLKLLGEKDNVNRLTGRHYLKFTGYGLCETFGLPKTEKPEHLMSKVISPAIKVLSPYFTGLKIMERGEGNKKEYMFCYDTCNTFLIEKGTN